MGKTKLGRFQVPVLSTNDNDTGKAIDARTGSPFSVGSGSGLPSNVLTKTENYTAAPGDCILADATAGAFTITLPTAASTGDAVLVKKTDASANAVAVAGTIDGDAGGMSITEQYFGAIFLSTGSDTWQRASVTEAGAASAPIDVFLFGEGSAPSLVAGTVASASVPPGYYKLGGDGGQVSLFGLVTVSAASASTYDDILASNLPFLPPLPSGYEYSPALNPDANVALAFVVVIRETGVPGVRQLTGYWYHDDPSYPDGFYLEPVASPPTADIVMYLSTITYLAAT